MAIKKQMLFSCADRGVLQAAAAELNQTEARAWQWAVVSESVAELHSLRLPMASLLQCRDVLGRSWRGAFWGLILGVIVALLLIEFAAMPTGAARSITLWSFAICCASFGGWVGGLLGLSRCHPALLDWQSLLHAGQHLILLRAAPADQRLAARILARGGAELLSVRDCGARAGLSELFSDRQPVASP